LGQNSKRQKLARLLGDIQIKMRLKVSGSRDEVRQDYMPLLASKIVLPMTRKEEAAVSLPCTVPVQYLTV
jgi:replication factor C subunit 1